jgi:AraC family transcriptional regulator
MIPACDGATHGWPGSDAGRHAHVALGIVLPAGGEARTEPPTLARGGLAPWQVGHLTRRIDDGLATTIRVNDLAEATQLSPSYFFRAFRASFGMSPHAYIVRRRMERAQEMMLTTDDNLSQIAIACGLCDQAHLCKLFRRAVGTSPHLWRCRRRTLPVHHARGRVRAEAG